MSDSLLHGFRGTAGALPRSEYRDSLIHLMYNKYWVHANVHVRSSLAPETDQPYTYLLTYSHGIQASRATFACKTGCMCNNIVIIYIIIYILAVLWSPCSPRPPLERSAWQWGTSTAGGWEQMLHTVPGTWGKKNVSYTSYMYYVALSFRT